MVCSKCRNIVSNGSQICNLCGNSLVNNSNNQVVQNNFANDEIFAIRKEPISFNKTQKKVILSMMLLIIFLLVSSVFLVLDNEEISLNDGSRTIMIYMVGSNLEYESMIVTSELKSIKPEDIDLGKINVLLYTGGTKKWFNFIKNDENAIYQLKQSGFEKVQTYDKKNMGDYNTLLDFLNYGYDNFSTQYYDVVFYNHGGAVDGAIYDDFTNDNLSLKEFSKALENSHFDEKNKLNTVLFRTCLNGTIEVASTFAPYAKYLIASEEVTNGGTNQSVLNYINEIDDKDDGISYGKKFIAAYEDQMKILDPLGLSSKSMYSIIDLSKIEEINNLLDKFISGIDLKKDYNNIVRVRSNLYQYGYTLFNISDFDTVDLYTMVERLSTYSKEDSTMLLKAIKEAVIYNWSEEEYSNGLSIYFPYNGSFDKQNYFMNLYKELNGGINYYNFINSFKGYSTSYNSTSFNTSSLSSSGTSLNKKEFSIKLTDEQVNDYAYSKFFLFRKNDEEDGFYFPIYSSENTILENNILKFTLTNNLIKVYDKSNLSDEGFVMLTEKGTGDKKLLITTALLHFYEDLGDYDFTWDMAPAFVYFIEEAGVPKAYNYVKIDQDEGVSGSVLDLNNFTYADFLYGSYKITDENGNFIDATDWVRSQYLYGYSIDVPDIAFKFSTIDDGEFYCVFGIKDIYGNKTYSKLIEVK